MSLCNMEKEGIVVENGCLAICFPFTGSRPYSRFVGNLLHEIIEWMNDVIEIHAMDLRADCCSISNYTIMRSDSVDKLGQKDVFSVVFVPGGEVIATLEVDPLGGKMLHRWRNATQ